MKSDGKNIPVRNYGIDLLRIVSTMMIVTLHVLGAGGVLETSKESSIIHYGFFGCWRLFAFARSIAMH